MKYSFPLALHLSRGHDWLATNNWLVMFHSYDCNSIFAPDLGGHLISMGAFGTAGYFAYKWDVRAGELLAQKRAEIAARRQESTAE